MNNYFNSRVNYKFSSGEVVKMIGEAHISSCEKYRYSLVRKWEESKGKVTYILLNPSKAVHNLSDHTLTKCIEFAKLWDYGALEIVILFAYRATDPKDLKAAGYPVGEDNDIYINNAVSDAKKIILGWGNHGNCKEGKKRYEEVLKLLKNKDLECWGITKEKQPRHPLTLAYSTTLQEYIMR